MKTVISLVAILCLVFCSAAYAEEITLSVDDYPPYIDQSLPNHGFLSEIVSKAFEKVGIEVVFSYRPWARVEREIEQKNAISFGYSFTEERGEKWEFSEPIVSAPTVFMARKDRRFSWNALEDLKSYRIGVTRGYSYGEAFDNFIPQLDLDDSANNDLNNLRKLLKQRIDLFPSDPYVGSALLQKHFSPEERQELELVLDPPLSNDTIHLVCSKDNPHCSESVAQFNKGLEMLTQEGVTQKLIEQALTLE